MLGWSVIMFSAWFERKPERGREGRLLFLATQVVEENRDELWDGVKVTAGNETTVSECWTDTSHEDQLLSSLSMESCFWYRTMQNRRPEHQNSISCSIFGCITFRVWAALHACCSVYWSGVLSVEAMINILQTDGKRCRMDLWYTYIAAVSNVVITFTYFIGRYTHFCLGYGQLITHTKHDITAGVRGI